MKTNDATELAYGQLNEGFKQGYDQGKTDGRKEAIKWAIKLIKIFWNDWNRTAKGKLSKVALDELIEHILEDADESNGRFFMQTTKQVEGFYNS